MFPTLMDAAHLSSPLDTPGESLLQVFRGESAPPDRPVLVENDVDALGLRLRTLITERWKLTTYAGQPYGEVYDLHEDPDEFVNLWEDVPRRRELQAEFLDAISVAQPWSPPKLCHA